MGWPSISGKVAALMLRIRLLSPPDAAVFIKISPFVGGLAVSTVSLQGVSVRWRSSTAFERGSSDSKKDEAKRELKRQIGHYIALAMLPLAASAKFTFARCGGCDEDPLSLFSVENILHCQKVSDFLIALAYFSIPLELLYFATCAAIFPFRWIFVQFAAFIILCGLTHLATVFTFSPHSFFLVLVLTVLKFLTALVSLATAITLLPLVPQILRVLVREGFLRKKTRDMDRELGLLKRQEETAWRVGEIIREIRRSLGRRTIIETAIAELVRVLLLESAAVWMPDLPSRLVLRHEIKSRRRSRPLLAASVQTDDPEISEIVSERRVFYLRPSSRLLCKEDESSGSAVAVRIPLRKSSTEEQDYAILVLVQPTDEDREWTPYELEIVQVVADQVSVALSHSSILEETLAMREKLQERNAALKCAQRQALKANEARALFRRVMSGEMKEPVEAVSKVFSTLQLEKLNPEQLAMARGGLVLSSLLKDMADVSTTEESKLEVSFRPFALRPVLVEAVALSKLLCCCQGIGFECAMTGKKKIPVGVVGDERHILEAVLSMISHLLGTGEREPVSLRIFVEEGSLGRWKQQGLYDDFVRIGFEVKRASSHSEEDHPSPGGGHSFTVCEHLARLMNGNLSVISASRSLGRGMSLVMKLQRQRSRELADISRVKLEGMRILLVDSDAVSRNAARRVLERVGCRLKTVSSWFECSELLFLRQSRFHLMLIDSAVLEKEGASMTVQLSQLCTAGWGVVIAMVPKGGEDAAIVAGVPGAIEKPLVLQELALELGRITKLSHASPAMPSSN